MFAPTNGSNFIVRFCAVAALMFVLYFISRVYSHSKCTINVQGIKREDRISYHGMNTFSRKCISPEIDKPWIFGDSCTSNISYGFSQTSRQSCSMCGTKFATYLNLLSKQIKTQKELECSQLIVYGVAFGGSYIRWLTGRSIRANKTHVHMLLKKHSRCFITFVLAESLNYSEKEDLLSLPLNRTSSDGLQILVPIHRSDLPYESMRRNTKIFKMMGPSLLFFWSQRVFWQDAKLVGGPTKPLPSNYFEYFHKTIERNHVCASFMGLPLHTNTMGTASTNKNFQTIQFAGHCSAIVEASVKRPTVSDDLETLQSQCIAYHQAVTADGPDHITLPKRKISKCHKNLIGMYDSIFASSEGLSLDKALIDSAFMVWDMRTKRCQNFVADISCTWLDEIHCYSDRDQVSFPFIFLKMGLREMKSPPLSGRSISSVLIAPETHHRVFAHFGTPSTPIVHITKSSCHWYFQGLDQCDFSANDLEDRNKKMTLSFPPSGSRLLSHSWLGGPRGSPHSTRLRLAVVVAGSLKRFVFQSSLQHLIKPTVYQGHMVDYFLALATNSDAPPYRDSSQYMSHIVHDPIFLKFAEHNTTAMIRNVIKEQLEAVGATLRQISLYDSVNIDSNSQLIRKRILASLQYPNEDPDLRFPILDLRKNARIRTANANRNMLNLFLSIQQLWRTVVDSEHKDGNSYDYVIFMRDDTMWLLDFDLNRLCSSHSADLYVLSCDARKPSMAPGEINDHIAIVSRNKADIFGNYYDELFATDLDACGLGLDGSVRNAGMRGCNSEMILQWVLSQKNVSIHMVGQSLIPFQRSGLVKIPDGNVEACFHKYCQSYDDGLLDAGLKTCSSMTIPG